VNTADESVAVAASEVMDQLIRTLMGRDEFVVVSRNAINTSHDGDSFRPEVDCVLTGGAFNRDGDIRVSIYLRDARSDAYLLSKVFEQPQLDDAALAAEIEQTAVEILRAVQGTKADQPDVPRLDVEQPAVAGSLPSPFSGPGRTSTASGGLPGRRPGFTGPGSAFL
jgi:TolB-like protein